MRFVELKIDRWRNLSDLYLEISKESGFLCLVGENGTGKTHLLELIHFASHNVGLAPNVTSKRQPPSATSDPYAVTAVLDVRDEDHDYSAGIHPDLHNALDHWDGRLIFESAGDRFEGGAPPPPAPINAATWTTDSFFFWIRVSAGGVPWESDAAILGQQIVGQHQQALDVLHLYIDAERVFPAVEVQDAEILALARQDLEAPSWVKQQAAIVTENLYLEWMRSMLGQQHQLQSQYYQEALEAGRRDDEIPRPTDFLDHYRDALARVLPHLEFLRLDQDKRRLLYNSAGTELPYESLSGGEREIAFLVGQIERFGITRGIFLLDEPELHLNAELMRGWLDYLRSAVDTGQVWIATHALEAVEAAGLDATLVLERDEDRRVRRIAPLGDRPALQTLAGLLGSPAFSLANSRFFLIEGDRPGRERERFSRVLKTPTTDRFFEVGGCDAVCRDLDALRRVASETEQLRVGGFVDRDFRTEDEVSTLTEERGVCVLPVHEIENFFLHPNALAALAEQAGRDAGDAATVLRTATDVRAGQWVWEKTVHELGWDENLGAARGLARDLTWNDIQHAPDQAFQAVVDAMPRLDAPERTRRRGLLGVRATEYRQLRQTDELWKRCFGKETLSRVARELGLIGPEAVEDRVVRLWREQVVARPPETEELHQYIASIPVLTNASADAA